MDTLPHIAIHSDSQCECRRAAKNVILLQRAHLMGFPAGVGGDVKPTRLPIKSVFAAADSAEQAQRPGCRHAYTADVIYDSPDGARFELAFDGALYTLTRIEKSHVRNEWCIDADKATVLAAVRRA